MGRLANVTIIIGLTAAACSGGDSGTRSVTDDQSLSRFELPVDWHTYELSELSTLDQLPFNVPYQGFNFPAMSARRAARRPSPGRRRARWCSCSPRVR